ncbi:uncharacterized protein [Primulina eburnea]|uniref:uncharacterized protein isoform X2 n=1 Tax=Primulina eburnea TaxID=1245227 RepID=UPI003C6C9362
MTKMKVKMLQPWRHFFDIEQLPKVRQKKFLRRKREADDELIRKEPRKSLADAESGTPLGTEAQRKKRIKVRSLEYGKGEKSVSGHLKDDQSNLSACEDEATHAPASDGQLNAEEQLEVHQTKLRRRKRETADECLRKLHPLRKSLAGDATESGTSFENGVRRSKRFKMRPLEFWKGERFLYGRVNGSKKLLGVKYISPGKNDGNLKVKPLILSNSPEYEDLLELAARH